MFSLGFKDERFIFIQNICSNAVSTLFQNFSEIFSGCFLFQKSIQKDIYTKRTIKKMRRFYEKRECDENIQKNT